MTITVADSGHGVPPEIASRIFDPFFTTMGVGQGSGLELHLSRLIVYNHGGRLELDATPGPGARFRIWLPAVLEATRDSQAWSHPLRRRRAGQPDDVQVLLW